MLSAFAAQAQTVRQRQRVFQEMLGSRFSDALVYVADLHRTQVRKGTPIPYIAHLLAVASLAIEHGADEDTAIAALLHDAVEDQGGRATLETIRTRYGARVAVIVAECSDADTSPKPPWKERKVAYIDSLSHKDAASLLISLADKVHNVRAILGDYRSEGARLWTRFTGGREGTLWYYRALRDGFRGRTPEALWTELDRTLSDLDALVAKSPANDS